MLAGDGVLHLDEAHPARRDEDVVRRRREPSRGQHRRCAPVEVRHHRRTRLAQATDEAEGRIGHRLVLDPSAPFAQRPHLLAVAQPVVALHQRAVGVREPVELEVLVVGGELVEPLHHLVYRHRPLVGHQRERLLALQRHRRHDAERADPDAGRCEQLRPLLRRACDDGAIADNQLEPDDLRGEATKLLAGAVRRRRGSTRDGLPVDVTEVGHREPVARQQPVELV